MLVRYKDSVGELTHIATRCACCSGVWYNLFFKTLRPVSLVSDKDLPTLVLGYEVVDGVPIDTFSGMVVVDGKAMPERKAVLLKGPGSFNWYILDTPEAFPPYDIKQRTGALFVRYRREVLWIKDKAVVTLPPIDVKPMKDGLCKTCWQNIDAGEYPAFSITDDIIFVETPAEEGLMVKMKVEGHRRSVGVYNLPEINLADGYVLYRSKDTVMVGKDKDNKPLKALPTKILTLCKDGEAVLLCVKFGTMPWLYVDAEVFLKEAIQRLGSPDYVQHMVRFIPDKEVTYA